MKRKTAWEPPRGSKANLVSFYGQLFFLFLFGWLYLKNGLQKTDLFWAPVAVLNVYFARFSYKQHQKHKQMIASLAEDHRIWMVTHRDAHLEFISAYGEEAYQDLGCHIYDKVIDQIKKDRREARRIGKRRPPNV